MWKEWEKGACKEAHIQANNNSERAVYRAK